MLSMPITSSPRSRSFIATCEPMKPAVPVTRTFIDFIGSKTPIYGVTRQDRLHVVDNGIGLAQRPDPTRAQIEELLMADSQDDSVVDALLHLLDRPQIVLVLGIRGVHPRVVDIDFGIT